MAVSLLGSTKASSDNSSATTTLADPGFAGAQLYALLFADDPTTSWTAPDGTWIKKSHDQFGSDGQTVDLFEKLSAVGSGSYVFTDANGAEHQGGLLVAIGGAAGIAAVDFQKQIDATPTNDPWVCVAPACTPDRDNCGLLAMFAIDPGANTGTDSWTTPSGYGTIQSEGPDTSGWCGGAAAFKALGSGTSGVSQSSASASDTRGVGTQAARVGYHIVIAPAAVAATFVPSTKLPVSGEAWQPVTPDVAQARRRAPTLGSLPPTSVPPGNNRGAMAAALFASLWAMPDPPAQRPEAVAPYAPAPAVSVAPPSRRLSVEILNSWYADADPAPTPQRKLSPPAPAWQPWLRPTGLIVDQWTPDPAPFRQEAPPQPPTAPAWIPRTELYPHVIEAWNVDPPAAISRPASFATQQPPPSVDTPPPARAQPHIIATWMDADPVLVRRLPVPPASTSVPADPPPVTRAQVHITWQPDADPQLAPRRFVPLASVDAPPPHRPAQPIAASWLDADPLPTLPSRSPPATPVTAAQVPPPRSLVPVLANWTDADPLPTLPERSPPPTPSVLAQVPPAHSLTAVLANWVDADPQPRLARQVPPASVVVVADTVLSPRSQLATLISWIPPDPQPTQGRRLTPPSVVVAADFVLSRRQQTALASWVDDVPFALPDRSVPPASIDQPPSRRAYQPSWEADLPLPALPLRRVPATQGLGLARQRLTAILSAWWSDDPPLPPARATAATKQSPFVSPSARPWQLIASWSQDDATTAAMLAGARRPVAAWFIPLPFVLPGPPPYTAIWIDSYPASAAWDDGGHPVAAKWDDGGYPVSFKEL